MLNLNISTPPLILNEIRIKYKEKGLFGVFANSLPDGWGKITT